MERTKQQGLNALVENRIKSKIEKGAVSARGAVSKMIAEGKISRDFILGVGTERKGVENNIIFSPNEKNKPTGYFLQLKDEEGNPAPEVFTINTHAIRQVSEKLGIPAVYLTNLLMGEEWQRTLGYTIMNSHNGWSKRDEVLVRTVGTEVRAFLSNQYRRLDSKLIFSSHIDEVFKNGGVLSDGFMDDTKVMVESMLPQPIEMHTELNGVIMLAFGTRLVTSDYGDGALDLRSFVMQGVCLNGMVRESVLRAVHLGAKLPSNLGLSQKTYALDSQTTSSAIRDLTKNLYSSDVVKTRMLEVKAASEMVVDPAQELKNLFISAKLLKGEADQIGKLLMNNSAMDGLQGEATLWKLTQGITAFANNEDISERRRMELQEIAGGLFNRIHTN